MEKKIIELIDTVDKLEDDMKRKRAFILISGVINVLLIGLILIE